VLAEATQAGEPAHGSVTEPPGEVVPA
jgi:hypothetical protein